MACPMSSLRGIIRRLQQSAGVPTSVISWAGRGVLPPSGVRVVAMSAFEGRKHAPISACAKIGFSGGSQSFRLRNSPATPGHGSAMLGSGWRKVGGTHRMMTDSTVSAKLMSAVSTVATNDAVDAAMTALSDPTPAGWWPSQVIWHIFACFCDLVTSLTLTSFLRDRSLCCGLLFFRVRSSALLLSCVHTYMSRASEAFPSHMIPVANLTPQPGVSDHVANTAYVATTAFITSSGCFRVRSVRSLPHHPHLPRCCTAFKPLDRTKQ